MVPRWKHGRWGLLSAVGLLLCTACTSISGENTGSINVLMVNNPQMMDLQRLTADNFTARTGIKVNFTVLPENEVRKKIKQEFSTQAGEYDVASISNYEVPFWAKNGWLAPLNDYVAGDPGFDQGDVLGPMTGSLTADDGKLYAEPFYGESSFLMYRQDVFEANGIRMPMTPTWQDVADIAARIENAQPGMRGICLRGQPGWGQVIAPLTTVVNTFGGTWFTQDWQPRLTSPEFIEATKFYVNLVRKHGEDDPAQAGYTECLNNVLQGKVAMWYDATAGAGSLEAPGSPVKSRMTYVQAPVVKTASAGWLYTWAWGVQRASKKQGNAWKFISWASGKDYEQLVGATFGWSKVPAGKRDSTYENPEYLSSAGAFAKPTELAIHSVDPRNPGVQPRPTIGIQFVDIPEFTDLGAKVSQEISAAIAGKISVEDALAQSQELAEQVAALYRK